MKGKNLDQFFRRGNHSYIYSKPLLEDLTLLVLCNHEEANSRLLLHTSHAATHGHHRILIRTVDNNIDVLAVSMAHALQLGDELWLAFGIGKSFRYFAAHEIAAGLGPEKARTRCSMRLQDATMCQALQDMGRRLHGPAGRCSRN